MNLSAYLSGLILVVVLAGACLAAILVYLAPNPTELFAMTLFYLSFFIVATGVFTLIGLFIRRVSQSGKFSSSKSRALRQIEISFRQGLLLTSILVAALVLQSQRMLAWWHLIVLVGGVSLIEWLLSHKG